MWSFQGGDNKTLKDHINQTNLFCIKNSCMVAPLWETLGLHKLSEAVTFTGCWCHCEWQLMELSFPPWLTEPVQSAADMTDTWEHSLLMRHNANQCCYLSQIICFQLQHIRHSVISALFMSDFQHIVRKHSAEGHKSAQITLNLFLSVLVLLKDFLK